MERKILKDFSRAANVSREVVWNPIGHDPPLKFLCGRSNINTEKDSASPRSSAGI
jgi:hypothetical protein